MTSVITVKFDAVEAPVIDKALTYVTDQRYANNSYRKYLDAMLHANPTVIVDNMRAGIKNTYEIEIVKLTKTVLLCGLSLYIEDLRKELGRRLLQLPDAKNDAACIQKNLDVAIEIQNGLKTVPTPVQD